jgi:hypothetical protein
MHFGANLADFRVFRIGDSLDQVVDTVEQYLQWGARASLRAARAIAHSRRRERNMHGNSPWVQAASYAM